MDFTIFGKYSKEAECCLPVLVETSQLSIQFRKNLSKNQIVSKEDKSPVTIFDFVIQAFIVKAITSQFPDDYIVAEESLSGASDNFLEQVKQYLPNDINLNQTFGKVHKTAPEGINRFWAIDPIDGTSGFKHNEPSQEAVSQYAVAICLIENQDCVFSAVGWPTQIPSLSGFQKAEPAFFYAARKIGSFYTTQSIFENHNNPKVGENGSGFIRVRVPKSPSKRQLLPPSQRSEVVEKMKEIAQNLGYEYDPIQCTSMTKGFSLALGIGSYYVRKPFYEPEYIFDIAPFSTFVEEAGGISTTGDGKKLLFTNDGYAAGTACGLLFSILGEEFHSKLVKEYSRIFEVEKIPH